MPLRKQAWERDNMKNKDYCDHCGKIIPTGKAYAVSSLPVNIDSANVGESAILCKACYGDKMTNKIPTDSQIIKDVTKAFAKADALGGNLIDCLPDYINCDDNLTNDHHYIGTLADGRKLFYTPEPWALGIVRIEEAK